MSCPERKPPPSIPGASALLAGATTLTLAAIFGFIAFRFITDSQGAFTIFMLCAFTVGAGTILATFYDRRWWAQSHRDWLFWFNFLTMFLGMIFWRAFLVYWPK